MPPLMIARRSVLRGGTAMTAAAIAAGSMSGPFAAASAIGRSGGTGRIAPLGTEALGHLNRFHSIARQAPGDWSGMGIEAVNQEGDDGFHMQLPYMAYALAVVQHSRTPAYRELYKATLDALIEKMRRNEVWDYWEAISSGEAEYGHAHHELIRPREADPLKSGNVMYSGHILPLLAMYEMFYRDGKWTRAGAFTLSRLNGAGALEHFRYDMDSVQASVVRQFEETGYLGMECFRDTIFPTTCNQFPIHGLIHYDWLKGTSAAQTVIPRHIEAWKKISNLYHTDKLTETPYVFYPSRDTLGLSDPVAFGKAQFMNVYVPEYVRTAYPVWREQLFAIGSDGVLQMRKADPMKEIGRDGGPPVPHVHEHGDQRPPAYLTGSNEQLAHKVPPAAMELGDEELAKAAYRFADQHNPPVWREGELYYERNDAHGTPSFLNRRASILIASGRMWSRDAYRNLYARPWGQTELAEPEVQGIDYPNVLVSEAYYDRQRSALTVTILPHGLLPSSNRPRALDTVFRVVRLDPKLRYRVLRDGIPTEPEARTADTLTIRTHLRAMPQTIVIEAV